MSLSPPLSTETVRGLTRYSTDAEATVGIVRDKALVPGNFLPAQNLVGTIQQAALVITAESVGDYAILCVISGTVANVSSGTIVVGSELRNMFYSFGTNGTSGNVLYNMNSVAMPGAWVYRGHTIPGSASTFGGMFQRAI